MVYIKEISIGESIRFGGYTIHGLQGLKQIIEKSVTKYRFREPPVNEIDHIVAPIHVGEVWESYPKFDSFDDCDNRTYQNYILRKSPITNAEMLRLVDMRTFGNDCRVDLTMPDDMLPMIYYKGDGRVMLLASASPVYKSKRGTFVIADSSSLFSTLWARFISLFL